MTPVPDRPIFTGDPREWLAGLPVAGIDFPPVTTRALAVATAVFHAASYWNQMFWSPTELQLFAWAQIFDCGPSGCKEWLTVDLAERAVHAHFRESITGHMLPAHVLHEAAILKLEEAP
ncbi:hypothetical protein [Nocardia cyriacigeorgica]|uniref:hypothetical protein n=1 Tax=Nocardia cyriacigeorgica TaxID=135487 RepID=UPI002455B2A3|nr:hypothetical protein [Nocardia cyriacigeorgica]